MVEKFFVPTFASDDQILSCALHTNYNQINLSILNNDPFLGNQKWRLQSEVFDSRQMK